ncbi:MAG: UbiA family prenyltransferase [Chloroflexi bacterium]|nr:UbiA family prenyltransferase [Chloroflexota bacterium]
MTAAIIPLADRDTGPRLYPQLAGGMLLFQFAIGVTNDIADTDLDRVGKPWKPLPRGLLSRRAAVLLAAAFSGAGLAVTSTLDIVPWLIGGAGLFCGLSYDLWLKRTILSWLPWSVAFPLIPAWVYSATGEWTPLLWWVFPLGLLLGLALYLANQAPDAAADSGAGVGGLAQRLGPRRSLRLGVAFFGAVASVAAVVLVAAGESGRAALVALTAALALLLVPRAARYFGRDGLFGLIAASGATIALVFLSAA